MDCLPPTVTASAPQIPKLMYIVRSPGAPNIGINTSSSAITASFLHISSDFGIPALGEIARTFWVNFVCFPRFSHFENKMGKFWVTCRIFPKCSHDFSQCVFLQYETASGFTMVLFYGTMYHIRYLSYYLYLLSYVFKKSTIYILIF